MIKCGVYDFRHQDPWVLLSNNCDPNILCPARICLAIFSRGSIFVLLLLLQLLLLPFVKPGIVT